MMGVTTGVSPVLGENQSCAGNLGFSVLLVMSSFLLGWLGCSADCILAFLLALTVRA